MGLTEKVPHDFRFGVLSCAYYRAGIADTLQFISRDLSELSAGTQ